MPATTFIYALCEPKSRTVRYIGKANNPGYRFKQHLRQSIHAKTHLGNWLRSLNENPNLVVLREVPDEHREIAEERYIKLARGLGMKLVNGTDGGDGLHNPGPETRAKLAANNKTRIWTPETRKKASESKLTSPESKAHMKRLHEARIGVPNSAEHNANIGKGQKGKVHTASHIKNKSEGIKASWPLRRLPCFSDGGGI